MAFPEAGIGWLHRSVGDNIETAGHGKEADGHVRDRSITHVPSDDDSIDYVQNYSQLETAVVDPALGEISYPANP
jgi:hypothetical protein